MEQFLKIYSDVPSGFIEDFFILNPTSNSTKFDSTKFTIEFDIVCKWLNTRKDHLKRLLVRNFEENYDYIIENRRIPHVNAKGSARSEYIQLTSDCFKELCMLSQTKKAKDVRKYFLAIERLLSKYHHHIENNLRSRIGLLESNQKPKYNISSGVIYILDAENQSIGQKLYKLGKSENFDNRLGTYNTGKAHDTEPLFILEVNDIKKVEKCIENLVQQYRYRKGREIYQISLDLLKKACMKCEELVTSFEHTALNLISDSELDRKLELMNDVDSKGNLVLQVEKF